MSAPSGAPGRLGFGLFLVAAILVPLIVDNAYLVSVAATNFVMFSETYTPIAGGSMPVEHYVYPENLAAAQVSLDVTTTAEAL